MFTHTVTVRLRDTDAAGILFFARQFELIHDAFEEFMASHGAGMRYIFAEAPYALVIVHAESDYAAPVRVGDTLAIQVRVECMGAKSFTMGYTLTNGGGTVVGRAKTIHVPIDKATRQATGVPESLREALDRDI